MTGSGVSQYNRWTYSMIGIPFHGESKITEQVPNQRSVSKQEDSRRTAGQVDYTTGSRVGWLRKSVKRNQREAQLSMENVKDRLEV